MNISLITGILFVIEFNGFSKQWGGGVASYHAHYRNEGDQYILAV